MVVLVDDERDVVNRKLGGEAGIDMGNGMGGKWRQAPTVERDIGFRRDEKEESPVMQENVKNRGNSSQASWPLQIDSQSLNGSVRSLARSSPHTQESEAKLREGPRRENLTHTRSPKVDSYTAATFTRHNGRSTEQMIRALPSKERLPREAGSGYMYGSRDNSRTGSRVQSRTASPGASFAL